VAIHLARRDHLPPPSDFEVTKPLRQALAMENCLQSIQARIANENTGTLTFQKRDSPLFVVLAHHSARLTGFEPATP